MLEQAELLEARELAAHGRRAPRDLSAAGEPLRADRCAELEVALDHEAQHVGLAGAERGVHAHIVAARFGAGSGDGP